LNADDKRVQEAKLILERLKKSQEERTKIDQSQPKKPIGTNRPVKKEKEEETKKSTKEEDNVKRFINI
jgi:hypothetical protein